MIHDIRAVRAVWARGGGVAARTEDSTGQPRRRATTVPRKAAPVPRVYVRDISFVPVAMVERKGVATFEGAPLLVPLHGEGSDDGFIREETFHFIGVTRHDATPSVVLLKEEPEITRRGASVLVLNPRDVERREAVDRCGRDSARVRVGACTGAEFRARAVWGKTEGDVGKESEHAGSEGKSCEADRPKKIKLKYNIIINKVFR